MKNIAAVSLGIAITGITIFANQLGLDNNPVWGAKRYLLLLFGIFIIVIGSLYREHNPLGRVFHSRIGQLYLASALLVAAIIVVYAWCVSLGLWTDWPPSSKYYDMQAISFSHGRLALEVEPDPAILALEDPYDPANREGIAFPWDTTYYEGKYYLYWGPAPALLLTLIKPFYNRIVEDSVITFIALSGTLIFLTLIILEVWKNNFPETPRWAVLFGIAFAGLVNPMTFILPFALIYEAAIASGQFFLVGGLYWLLTAFRSHSVPRLILAGLFFAFAVGSRNTLLIPVAFLALVVVVWAVKTHRAKAFAFILALGLPLVLGAVSYGWYNYARFDSVTEFGYRYQFTSYNMRASIGDTFSIAYIPPNLFKTLLNPLERRGNFPFIRAVRWVGPTWLKDIMPDFYLYYAEGITGLLVGSPFVIFALLAGVRRRKDLTWILFSLAGCAAAVFITLQVFFFTTMRYLLDLIPTLSLLAVIGFWNGLGLLRPSTAPSLRSGLWLRTGPRRVARWIYTALGILLAIYGLAISFLLTVSSNLQRFEAHNPDLLERMRWTFNSLIR